MEDLSAEEKEELARPFLENALKENGATARLATEDRGACGRDEQRQAVRLARR